LPRQGIIFFMITAVKKEKGSGMEIKRLTSKMTRHLLRD